MTLDQSDTRCVIMCSMGSKRNGGANFGTASSGRVAATQRVKRALELRRAGYTTAEIVDKVSAYQEFDDPDKKVNEEIAAELDRITIGPARKMVALQLARYDALLTAVFDTALEGDIPAHKQALATVQAQSQLLRLDSKIGDEGGSDVDSWLDHMIGKEAEAESTDIEDEPERGDPLDAL